MAWEELKQKLKELGVSCDDSFSKSVCLFDYCLVYSIEGDLYTCEGPDVALAKGMSYEDMYKVVEILCKYRSK